MPIIFLPDIVEGINLPDLEPCECCGGTVVGVEGSIEDIDSAPYSLRYFAFWIDGNPRHSFHFDLILGYPEWESGGTLVSLQYHPEDGFLFTEPSKKPIVLRSTLQAKRPASVTLEDDVVMSAMKIVEFIFRHDSRVSEVANS